jgi:tetratricopeptide (TPR) repeat protein/uncharacterized protein YraI
LSIILGASLTSAQNCDLDSAEAFAERGRTAQNNGNDQASIDDYTCAIALNDQEPEYYNNRGISYENLNLYSEALDDYNKALELDENYWYAYNNRGNIYYYRGQYDTAIADYTASIEIRPVGDSAHVPYYNRGNTYHERGEYQQALADYNEAINDNPNYERAYLGRATTYLVLNDERAHADYLEWIEINAFDRQDTPLADINEPLALQDGRAFYITFDAQGTQVLDVSARTNSDADPLLVLLDPNGLPIASDDDSGVNLDAVMRDVSLPSSGTYTLVLGHAGGRDSGNVNLSINLDNQLITTNTGDAGDTQQTVFASYTLYPNTTAEVYTTGGDTLNLREGPGIDFEIIERLEPGALVTLLEGPRKNDDDGYVWWRIRTEEGVEGWSVERADQEQTLQLALIVGEDAVISTGGDLLNMRGGAGTNFDVVAQLEEGSRVTLLEAPVITTYRWWKVRTADGIEGFVIDRFEGDRMLIPARELDYAG